MGDGGGGGWGGVGGGEDSFSLVFENSIVLIKCTLYDTVFQRQVSICRGVVFSYSFSIYCAAYHGIWCSVGPFSSFQVLFNNTDKMSMRYQLSVLYIFII